MTALRIAGISVAVALVVLGLKTAAWWITGSTALLADALESVVNLAAAGAALWALSVARLPADANHPFGHQKAEYLSAVLEGVLIVLAALSILWEAWHAFADLRSPEDAYLGIAVNAAATTLNLLWAMVLLRRGRALRSPALMADGRHLMADVVTSTGVIAALALIPVTGWLWLDPTLAALTALHILGSGARLVRESMAGLMDEAVEASTLDRIKVIVSETAEGAIEAHDIRTRQAGRTTFLDFHLVVPAAMSVAEAHDICDRIEAALKREVEGLSVTIHVEPEGKAKQTGIRVLGLALLACLVLAAPLRAEPAAPARIVSINLCSDQYLLLLADPRRIAGVTPLARDPLLSAEHERAQDVPVVRAEAEAVLALRPDLVLAGAWGSPLTRRAIEARGIPVVALPSPVDFDGIAEVLVQAGRALHAVERAALLVHLFQASRAAIASFPVPQRSALLWQARGFASGQATFPGAVLREAGLVNAAPFAGYGFVPLEAVLADPPALLVVTTQRGAPSLAASLLLHPALAGIEQRSLEPALLTCATPRSLEAVAALRDLAP